MGFLKFLFPVCFFWYFLLFGSVDIQHFTIRKQILSEEDYNALRAEITRLKKELRQEKMRAEALDTMIDVAEEMFNIPVRKKAGTKQ